MAKLTAYMVSIVLILTAYSIGLHRLITPASPWEKSQQAPGLLKRTIAKPREPAAQTADLYPSSENYEVKDRAIQSVEREAPPATKKIQTSTQDAKVPEVVTPIKSDYREGDTVRRPNRSVNRPQRKLVRMILRTYERPDGTRFTRLLPIDKQHSIHIELD